MDAAALVQFIYEAGNELVKRCALAKQCHTESTRIAVRTLRALGSLEEAAGEFSGNAKFGASLVDLKRVLEEAHDLMKRCQRPKTISAKIRAITRANVNKGALIGVEEELKRITDDLQIPMLTDIRRAIQQVHDREVGGELDQNVLQEAVQEAIGKELGARNAGGRGSVREIIDANVSRAGAAAPASGSDLPGQLMLRLGRVRFDMLQEGEDVLGEGAFGIVKTGEYMGEQVAIKKARGMIGDTAVLRDFRREAEVHFVINHENIVRVLAFFEGSPERAPFLVMERMEESLSSLLKMLRDPLPIGERLEVIKDVCKALLFLHQHRIIHRDVKSANVLIDGRGTAKLSDFGLAVIEASVATSTLSDASSVGVSSGTGQKVGSAHYMAPEVHASTHATSASDVFSLHVVMWEIVTHARVGVGSPIGEKLRRSPDAKLVVSNSVPAAHHDGIQALLDSCGHVDHKQRPRMEVVLQEMEVIRQHLNNVPSPVALAKDAETDRVALMKVFEATSGGSWKHSSGWGTSRPLGEWHGVFVDSRSRVVKLDLKENNLQGVIPSALGELTGLKILYLDSNKLTGVIPSALGELKGLTKLGLDNNKLSGAMPASLGGLTNLTNLNLRSNELTGVILPRGHARHRGSGGSGGDVDEIDSSRHSKRRARGSRTSRAGPDRSRSFSSGGSYDGGGSGGSGHGTEDEEAEEEEEENDDDDDLSSEISENTDERERDGRERRRSSKNHHRSKGRASPRAAAAAAVPLRQRLQRHKSDGAGVSRHARRRAEAAEAAAGGLADDDDNNNNNPKVAAAAAAATTAAGRGRAARDPAVPELPPGPVFKSVSGGGGSGGQEIRDLIASTRAHSSSAFKSAGAAELPRGEEAVVAEDARRQHRRRSTRERSRERPAAGLSRERSRGASRERWPREASRERARHDGSGGGGGGAGAAGARGNGSGSIITAGNTTKCRKPAPVEITFDTGIPFGVGEYVGQVVDGVPHGQGTMEWPQGQRYTGTWKGGRRNGYGTFSAYDGRVHQGDWVNNKAHGKGTFWVGDGTSYTGGWVDGLKHGQGTRTYPGGVMYKGGWINGSRHGKGVWSGPDGIFDGEYRNDKKNGFGTYVWSDGRKHVGNWRDGKQHGKGVLYARDGKITIQGKWKKGEKTLLF